MTSNQAGILRRAIDRISDERRWCQRGDMAQTAKGVPCDPRSSRAARWCMLGAIYREASESTDRRAIYKAIHPVGYALLGEWNDTHTHAEVISLMRRALPSN